MHGGKVFLRSNGNGIDFPKHVTASAASDEDIKSIEKYISCFCEQFGIDKQTIINSQFTKVEPDVKNPYKQMYVAN